MSAIILLTGATGFVGRQVLTALAACDVRLRVVVRDGKQDQLATIAGIETVVTTLDLFNEGVDWWINVCSGIDTVIHVACY